VPFISTKVLPYSGQVCILRTKRSALKNHLLQTSPAEQERVRCGEKESFLIGQISQNHRQPLITRNSLTSLDEKRIQLFDHSGMLLVY
jgi:hypothetical protein